MLDCSPKGAAAPREPPTVVAVTASSADLSSRVLALRGRCDIVVRYALRSALRAAGTAERLTVERLFLSLLAVDGAFLVRKLRSTGLPLRDLLQQLRDHVRVASSGDLPRVAATLALCGDLAAERPISSQHLTVAILLEGSNRIAQRLIHSGVDRERLLRSKFSYIPRAPEVLRQLTGRDEAPTPLASPEELDSLGRAVTALTPVAFPAPLPIAPRRLELSATPQRAARPVSAIARAEETARRWFRKLLPHQVESYERTGIVRVPSGMFPGTTYRIYGSGRLTEVIEGDRTVARCCIHPRRPSLPPTDRVIAEYFLIRGDEEKYLATANINSY